MTFIYLKIKFWIPIILTNCNVQQINSSDKKLPLYLNVIPFIDCKLDDLLDFTPKISFETQLYFRIYFKRWPELCGGITCVKWSNYWIRYFLFCGRNRIKYLSYIFITILSCHSVRSLVLNILLVSIIINMYKNQFHHWIFFKL